MSKKSRFWGSFWGETGRNTGKWASNKLFGPSGWATPRRHIFENEASSVESTSTTGRNSDTTEEWDEHRINHLLEIANEITFNDSDVDSICGSLENLLTAARKANKYAQNNKLSSNIFQTKINAGIMRLRRLSEKELADFYQLELKKVKRSTLWKKAVPIVFMLGLLLFILVMIKFTSGMKQESNPVQDWLNGK